MGRKHLRGRLTAEPQARPCTQIRPGPGGLHPPQGTAGSLSRRGRAEFRARAHQDAAARRRSALHAPPLHTATARKARAAAGARGTLPPQPAEGARGGRAPRTRARGACPEDVCARRPRPEDACAGGVPAAGRQQSVGERRGSAACSAAAAAAARGARAPAGSKERAAAACVLGAARSARSGGGGARGRWRSPRTSSTGWSTPRAGARLARNAARASPRTRCAWPSWCRCARPLCARWGEGV